MPELDPIQALREAPVDARRLAAVRRRVLARVGRRRSGPGRWLFAGAIAALALVAGIAIPNREPYALPELVSRLPKPPEWALTPTPRKPPVAQAATLAGARAVATETSSTEVKLLTIQAAPAEGEPETAVLEIPTSNPDVVLYWLVDGGGD